MVLPARLRIFSVTLFHSQTSYCAEAGRAAFCGTPAAHLPNGNRFGGGVAVRQQGGRKPGRYARDSRQRAGDHHRGPFVVAVSAHIVPAFFFAPPSDIAALKTTTFCKQPATVPGGQIATWETQVRTRASGPPWKPREAALNAPLSSCPYEAIARIGCRRARRGRQRHGHLTKSSGGCKPTCA